MENIKETSEEVVTIEQLKVKAYDLIAHYEQVNGYAVQIKSELDKVNAEIAKLQTPQE
jgi:uncharacterized protein YukE